MNKRVMLRVTSLSLVALISISGMLPSHAQAIPNDDFSIEVSPSPLTATVEPGKPATIELKVRNAGKKQEQLKIESRSFSVGKDDQAVTISDSAPAQMSEWIRYSDPIFSIDPGTWFTQRITIDLPESAGFTYPFTVVISRANEQADSSSSGRLLKGSVAVFALVNIDKPGATRKLEMTSFSTTQAVYEYLPVQLSLRLENTGNSIVQPYGNFYIQRGSDTEKPIDILPVNDNQAYILPGSSREMKAEWRNGYPVFIEKDSGVNLEWTPLTGAQFRFGQYTAKVVAVYNDGARDVPIIGEVTFWVIPWKLLLILLVIAIVLIIGIWSLIRRLVRKIKGIRKAPEI